MANNHNPSKIMKILVKDYDNQELLVELRQISIKIFNSELGWKSKNMIGQDIKRGRGSNWRKRNNQYDEAINPWDWETILLNL